MKTMIYSKQQNAFIEKVNNAIANAKEYNYTINDTTPLLQDFTNHKAWAKKYNNWWIDIQRPNLANTYKRLYKRYGYVDKKLFAKCVYNTLSYVSKYNGNDYSLCYIKREWNALQEHDKYLLCYELAKTFRK